jgi:hypothetical protein
VDRNTISPETLGISSSPDNVGIISTTAVPKGGKLVDVYR